MDFIYDSEQTALRDAVRGLLGARPTRLREPARRSTAEDPGFDEKLWARLAEMGVLGLPFAEEDGGMGAGPVEVGIVAEELGRVIAPEPFLTRWCWPAGWSPPRQRRAAEGHLIGGSPPARSCPRSR